MRRPHGGLRSAAAILPTACSIAKTWPAQAIEYFAAQGVAVKEISEDSPLAVPLLPPGSACLTPADRSTRETRRDHGGAKNSGPDAGGCGASGGRCVPGRDFRSAACHARRR